MTHAKEAEAHWHCRPQLLDSRVLVEPVILIVLVLQVLALERGVPVVLHAIVGAADQELRDRCPLVLPSLQNVKDKEPDLRNLSCTRCDASISACSKLVTYWCNFP